MAQFKIGEKVKVIDFGELIVKSPNCTSCANTEWWDAMPSVIGKIGVVKEVSNSVAAPLYALSGIPEKDRWYKEQQLKLIT